jgi:hypothetical protein
VSVEALIDIFWEKNPEVKGYLKDRVNHYEQLCLQTTGADMDQASALNKEYLPHRAFFNDYLLKNGMYSLFQEIFDQLCDPTLHLR